MKRLIILLLLISSFFAKGQNNQFPMSPTSSNVDEQARYQVEGTPLNNAISSYDNSVATTQNSSTANGTVPNNTLVVSVSVPPSRVWYIHYIVLRNYSKTVRLSVKVQRIDGLEVPSANSSMTNYIKIDTNSYVTIPVEAYNYEHQLIAVFSDGALTGNFYLTESIVADNLSSDMNYDATNQLLGFGDSITNSTGVNNGNQFYYNIALDTLRAQGYTIRTVRIGNSGWTSANWLEHIQAPQTCIIGKPLAIWVNYGMNDDIPYSTGGATATTIQNNFAKGIALLLKRYPGSPILMCGQTPRQDSYETSGAIPLRTWLSGYITTLANPLVHYIDLSTGFNNTINSLYFDSVGGSSVGIHPSASGQIIVGSNFLTGINSLSLVFQK